MVDSLQFKPIHFTTFSGVGGERLRYKKLEDLQLVLHESIVWLFCRDRRAVCDMFGLARATLASFGFQNAFLLGEGSRNGRFAIAVDCQRVKIDRWMDR